MNIRTIRPSGRQTHSAPASPTAQRSPATPGASTRVPSGVGRLALALLGAWGATAVPQGPAFAAAETHVAPFLHGEIGGMFNATSQRSRFYQYGVTVGRMTEGEATPELELRFGVIPGLELFGSIPYAASGSRTYEEVSAMCGDSVHPGEQPTGTEPGCTPGQMVYVAGGEYLPNPTVAATDLPVWNYSGIDNVVLGLRFAPLHEAELGKLGTGRAQSKRAFPPRATWRLELGLLLNTGGNFYTGGAGAGATGVRLGTSFSKHVGDVAEPYFSFTHDRFGAYTYTGVDLISGDPFSLELATPNRTQVFFGVELTPFEDKATGARFSVDFAGGTLLLSEAPVLSGSRLPVIVTSGDGNAGTNGTVTVEQSQLAFQGRLRLRYQLIEHLRIEAGGELGYFMPHQLERSYTVELGSHLLAGLKLGLVASF